MSTLIGVDDPAGDVLKHYGVLGMKWGRRKASIASGSDVHAARSAIRSQKNKIQKQQAKNLNAKSDKERSQGEKALSKLEQDLKNDPRRAIAARTTRGEKALILILGGGAIGATVIAGTSARSRRIEYTQDKAAGRKP